MTAEPGAARLAVRWQKLDALKPDPNNARAHSDGQIERIADSIAAFGFNVPVLVDRQGGVLAGHARVLAARRLGLTELPTIVIDHLDEARRRAFMIADNRLAELSSWDGVRLGLELEALRKLKPDFALSTTGFELREIDVRIGSPVAAPRVKPGGDDRGSRVDDRVLQRPVARAGDVWRLGPHRLARADAAVSDRGYRGDAAVSAPGLDPEGGYKAIDGAIQRWQALAQEDARLASTGEAFAAVARARRRAANRKAGGDRR